MPSKRQRLPAEERRKQILRSAVRVFARSNYRAAKVADIAAEAGVSEALLYKFFDSKQAIFLELLRGWLGAIDAGFEAVRGPTVPETLMGMTGTLPAIFASADDRLHMFLEFWLQASRDDKIWEATISPYRSNPHTGIMAATTRS